MVGTKPQPYTCIMYDGCITVEGVTPDSTMSAVSGRKSANQKRQTSACRRKIPCAICQLQLLMAKMRRYSVNQTASFGIIVAVLAYSPNVTKSCPPAFVCPSCTVLDQRRKIVELCSTVSALREEVSHMQETSIQSAIKAEVTQLKQILNNREQRDSSNNSVNISYLGSDELRFCYCCEIELYESSCTPQSNCSCCYSKADPA